MGYIVKMPQMGMSMDEGTVVEWSVEEGESVEAEEVVAVVESEKASADVEAREAGVLRRIVVEAGGVVEPGTPIGLIAGPDEDVSEYESRIGSVDAGSATETDESATGDRSDGASGPSGDGADASGDVTATPGARQLASEEGVDLATVEGTGPQGVVTEDDVESAVEDREDVTATPGAKQLASERGIDLRSVEGTGPQGVVTEDDVESAAGGGDGPDGAVTRTVAESRSLSGLQSTISERLSESYREAVHVTLNRSFDTSTVQSVLGAADEAGADGGLTDLLLKAVGATLRTHPEFNAVFEDGEHRLISEVNVGVAVDVEAGLLTPVIGDVDEKSIEAVHAARASLVEDVRSGEYTMDDLSGGTFTVSNLGPFGVDSFDPVINPPEIAIVGVGRIRENDTMTLSLSFDHRVVNGADAARFLDTLVGVLGDRDRLAGFYEADLGDEAGLTEPREIRIETDAGYSGRYRTAFGDVAFDEPEDAGGSGSAPAPVDHLLGALGSCLSLSVRAMAQRDGVEVGAITADVSGAPREGGLSEVAVELTIATEADEGEIDRVITKAERACYVSQALAEDLSMSLMWERA